MREWVTSDDQSLLVLENPFLLRAVEYLNYKGLAGMVTANTLKSDIEKDYELGENRRADLMAVYTGQR
jgi:hypothetical protein